MNIKQCSDQTRLLPQCIECIPGLSQSPGSNTCNELIQSSKEIRDEIEKLTKERYGNNLPSNRKYGLYPYLEKPDFLLRHYIFGQMLSDRNSQNIIDIGAYYNPVYLYLNQSHCPASVVVIEPILEAMSALLPCHASSKSTHLIVLPITFKHYTTIKSLLPIPEAVVCIGCDSVYGPNRHMLEAFQRPYDLYLEFPVDYIHNAPFRKMLGQGKGEKLQYSYQFRPNTNETIYTNRMMKLIEYR